MRQAIISEIEKLDLITPEDSKLRRGETQKEFSERIAREFYFNFYKPHLKRLLSFDLSGISKDDWENFPLITMDEDVLDFEGTYANIDFKIVDLSAVQKYNFKTCHIDNLIYANCTIDPHSFDSSFIAAHPDFFLDESYPSDFADKYYGGTLSFVDYESLSDVQKKKIGDDAFLSRISPAERDFAFSLANISSRVYSLLPEENAKLFRLSSILKTRFDEIARVYDYLKKIAVFDNKKEKELTSIALTDSLIDDIYECARKFLNDLSYAPNPQEAPEELVNKFPELYFMDLDEPLREKIWTKELTLDDYLDNYDILKKRVPWTSFRNIEVGIVMKSFYAFEDNDLDEMCRHHRHFLTYITTKSPWNWIGIHKEADTTLDDMIVSHLDKENYSRQIYNTMAAHIRDLQISSFEELATELSNLAPAIRSILSAMIDRFGLENLIAFDHKTAGSLSHNGLYNFSLIGFYAIKKRPSNPCRTYDEFLDDFASTLKKMLINGYRENLDHDIFAVGLKDSPEGNIFLSENESAIVRRLGEDIEKKFENFELTVEDILKYPVLQNVLEDKDVGFFMKKNGHQNIPLVDSLGNKLFFRILKIYGPLTETIFRRNIVLSEKETLESLEAKIDKIFYEDITSGRLDDYSSLPVNFQKTYPHLFLKSPYEDLNHAFASRTLTFEDFEAHPEYLACFKYTDLFAGLNSSYANLIGRINLPCTKEQNMNKLKIARFISMTSLTGNRHDFIAYCIRHIDNLDETKLKDALLILNRLTYSNSGKLSRLKDELCDKILESEHPISALNQIERVYLTNNLPDTAKNFAVFRILHSNKDGSLSLNLKDISSPVLNAHSRTSNEIIIYSDLLKSAIESNNLSLRHYIRSLEEGERLFSFIDISNFDCLTVEEHKILEEYVNHLYALYKQTSRGKREPIERTGDLAYDLMMIKHYFGNCTNLFDHLVRTFMHFIGIDDLATLKATMEKRVHNRDVQSRKIEFEQFKLQSGDMIKGLGVKSLDYLFPTMQNGALSSEFLGSQATSIGDMTPLDTDLSLIKEPSFNMSATINSSISNSYGPIWLVIKSTNPLVYISRGISKKESGKYLKDKLEAFETDSPTHYGIRTGFGSTNIDFIIAENYTPHMGLAIAMQGFYIPIVDREGKLKFTSSTFDEYRRAMEGLSYYGMNEYTVSDRLVTEEIEQIAASLPNAIEEANKKAEKIKEIIRLAVSKVMLDGENTHLKVTDYMDGNIAPGTIELINIGSTSRATSDFAESDFDFMVRIDTDIIASSTKMNALKDAIRTVFGQSDSDFHYKEICIPGIADTLDIDISFVPKTDTINYTTDEAIKDKLRTIEKTAPTKYNYVLANIIYAKKILKEAGCYYKNGHSKCVAGGLGGVGIENWILAHHGSFIEAAEDFLDVAKNYPDYEDFKRHYTIWDFGENFYFGKDDKHDRITDKYENFVCSNMTSDGFEKMKKALALTLEKIKREDTSFDLQSEEDKKKSAI